MPVTEEAITRSGTRCHVGMAKYITFLFDFVIVITGIGLVVIGYFTFKELALPIYFLDSKMLISPITFMFVGTVIFLFSFLGCYGALAENYQALIIFSLGILACLFLQVAAGFLAVYYKFVFSNPLRASLKSSIQHYNVTVEDEVHRSWDDVQKELDCCGVDTSHDWKPQFGPDFVPSSCCTHIPEERRSPERCSRIVYGKVFQMGCYIQLQAAVMNNLDWLAIAAFSLVLFEMSGIILALIAARTIKTHLMLKKRMHAT